MSANASAVTATRAFGWSMLAVLAVYLIDNVLTVGLDWPGSSQALAGGGGAAAWGQLALYVLAIGAAIAFVRTTPARSLRRDAERISAFNAYLIRACFWAVLLVGVADAAIAFMRVENLLAGLVGQEAAHALGRARDVSLNVHMPLIAASFVVALFTRTLGFVWLALLIVVSRFVFSYEQALMGDLVRYWYAGLFLFASAYTLIEEGHVRVDVLYAGMTSRTKGIVNAVGSVALGMSTCWVVLAIGFGGKQSINNSPVANFEVSQTGNVGMFIKYQMAIFLGVFGVTMLIQFVSFLFQAVADIRNEPGHVDHAPATH
ncbi:MAG: TRAP transporter small permease subunit [Alphaproteobacteria bacterium]